MPTTNADKLSNSETTKPTKMVAKVYDVNYRLQYSIKGEFEKAHFVWYEGGLPVLRVLPILKNIEFIGKHRNQISCDFDETYDEVSSYVALYRKIGDRFEQIKIRGSTTSTNAKDQINLEQVLLKIELAQSRADSQVKDPNSLLQMATIMTAILAFLVVIGLYFAGQSAVQPVIAAFKPSNASLHSLNSNFSSMRNITANLTSAYKNSTKVDVQLLKYFKYITNVT